VKKGGTVKKNLFTPLVRLLPAHLGDEVFLFGQKNQLEYEK
jgi:hypothetical protein